MEVFFSPLVLINGVIEYWTACHPCRLHPVTWYPIRAVVFVGDLVSIYSCTCAILQHVPSGGIVVIPRFHFHLLHNNARVDVPPRVEFCLKDIFSFTSVLFLFSLTLSLFQLLKHIYVFL
jgi:hypothetical protein